MLNVIISGIKVSSFVAYFLYLADVSKAINYLKLLKLYFLDPICLCTLALLFTRVHQNASFIRENPKFF